MGIVEKLEGYKERLFYRHNPVEMSPSEQKVEGLLPRKPEVVDGGTEPMSTREVRRRMEEEHGTAKNTTYQMLKSLREKGAIEKPTESAWWSLGRTKLVLDEDRVAGCMLVFSFSCLILGSTFLEPSFTYFGLIFAVLAVLFKKF